MPSTNPPTYTTQQFDAAFVNSYHQLASTLLNQNDRRPEGWELLAVALFHTNERIAQQWSSVAEGTGTNPIKAVIKAIGKAADRLARDNHTPPCIFRERFNAIRYHYGGTTRFRHTRRPVPSLPADPTLEQLARCEAYQQRHAVDIGLEFYVKLHLAISKCKLRAAAITAIMKAFGYTNPGNAAQLITSAKHEACKSDGTVHDWRYLPPIPVPGLLDLPPLPVVQPAQVAPVINNLALPGHLAQGNEVRRAAQGGNALAIAFSRNDGISPTTPATEPSAHTFSS